MSFEFYLRTGRLLRPDNAKPELKFNAWHDPDDGRFTFAGQGRRFGGGAFQGGGSFGGGGAGGSRDSPKKNGGGRFYRFDPKNPANHSLYTVKRGETLTSVASKWKGLSASDLAWLNGLRADDRLKIGQQLKVPNQAYLDAGRAAKNNFLALAYYIDTHGHLPPGPSHAPRPTVEAAHRPPTINKNGYRYDFDNAVRTMDVKGELSLQRERRSSSAQENAGKPDRCRGDDGGHFIAARFNDPREWFNHFAQDAKFNRGAYRVLEDGWARDVRASKKVFVEIVPTYRGTSRRPYQLKIKWYVDGKPSQKKLANEGGGN